MSSASGPNATGCPVPDIDPPLPVRPAALTGRWGLRGYACELAAEGYSTFDIAHRLDTSFDAVEQALRSPAGRAYLKALRGHPRYVATRERLEREGVVPRA